MQQKNRSDLSHLYLQQKIIKFIMEHERSEGQTPIGFRCKKVLPGVVKKDDPYSVTQVTEIEEKKDSKNNLASPTPEKPEWRSKAKGVTSYARKDTCLPTNIKNEDVIIPSEMVNPESINDKDSSVSDPSLRSLAVSRSLKDKHIELPEKYMILADLFSRMETSIRLLGLLKMLPTFQNICTQVEVLSKRKFLCSHLAQMKYIYPEAILIEKILVHDMKSLCMKPDMKITLSLEVVGCSLDPDQSASMALCQAFHTRLVEFIVAHPEDTDIPEVMLPEPFNKTSQSGLSNTLLDGPFIEVSQQASVDSVPLFGASHFSSSFSTKFTKKVVVPQTKLTQLHASPISLASINAVDEGEGISESPLKKDNLCPVSCTKYPSEVMYTPSRSTASQSECTPARNDSNTNEAMTETPALQTPKRPIPTPHEKSVIAVEKLLDEPRSTPSVRRSLLYSPSKIDGSVADGEVCIIEQETFQYSCQQTAATKRSIFGEEIGGSLANRLQMAGKRHELLAMFDTVCVISQSTDCSMITKQELFHKIISNNLDIEETGEVEEQLMLLEELIPDWIRKRSISSGDSVYSIKHASDLESVRARLVEAV